MTRLDVHTPDDAEAPPRYAVGVDLGTTNSAVAYFDTAARRSGVATFRVPQVTAPGESEALETLPSFHYEPAAAELGEGGAAPFELAWGPPWKKGEPPWVVGVYARERGARVPGRLVASAKSWLSHSRVDRRASLLPLHGAPDLRKISPVTASTRYLAHVRAAWDHAFPEHPLAEQDVVLTVPASFDEIARELTVEAAREAGLPRVLLLEEPQAAFYAWIDAAGDDWDRGIEPGQRVLVCDVGGGTTDLSLLEVRRADPDGGDGPVRFHRIAVGDHLLLGGDNMDLALAHHVEAKLGRGSAAKRPGEDRLDPEAWNALVGQCRHAKELLLGDDPPAAATLSIPARGARVVGGALQVELGREEVVEELLDGFLPRAALGDAPRGRTGFQEFGLPYAPDPGITRYAGRFLREVGARLAAQGDPQPAGACRPDYLLFNGGVLASTAVRRRLVEVVRGWFSEDADWDLRLLENERLDLAVARGAAYYGRVRRGEGVRIAGGLALTYYVGVESQATEPTAVCLIPAGLEEGEGVELERDLELRIRQPVEFPVYVSAARTTDAAGELVRVSSEELRALPPIRTVLRSGRKAAAADTVGVRLGCRLTEVGTLDISCRETAGNRSWRLRFDARSASQTDVEAHTGGGEAAGVLDEASVEGLRGLLEETFGSEGGRPGAAPDQLVRRMEAATGLSRRRWPPSLLREIWESLIELAAGRRRGAMHETRWLNLLGWALRPGYGLALDDWRVGRTWRFSLSNKVEHGRNEQCRAEWWVLWRRIAGGLSAGQQAALAAPLLRLVAAPPSRGRGRGKGRAKGSAGGVAFLGGSHETAEVWRLLGALEWLEPATKIVLGERILQALAEHGPRLWNGAGIWALGRLGARVPQHGPLNTLVPPDTIESWLDALLRRDEGGEARPNVLGPVSFAAVQLARRTDDRYRDVGSTMRGRVGEWLAGRDAPLHYRELVESGGSLDAEEQEAAFGESLPAGIRLRG